MSDTVDRCWMNFGDRSFQKNIMRPGTRNRQNSCRHTFGEFPKSHSASAAAAQMIEYVSIIRKTRPLTRAANRRFSTSEQITSAASSAGDFQTPDLSWEITPSLNINSCAQSANQPPARRIREQQKDAWIKEKSMLTGRAPALTGELCKLSGSM